jgi:hypothetical protein
MTSKLLWGLLSIALVISGGVTGCVELSPLDRPSQTSSISTRGIATVESIDASIPYFSLRVFLKPQKAKANTDYLVQLCESSQVREQQIITWTQPEINVKTTKVVSFHFKQGEDYVYMNASMRDSNWWKPIFNINIYDMTPSPPPQDASLTGNTSTTTRPSITIISPNGGEVWHIGDKVSLHWSSNNYTDIVHISLSSDSGKTWSEIVAPTANKVVDWIVTGVPSFHCRIKIIGVGNDLTLYPDSAESATDFTISK